MEIYTYKKVVTYDEKGNVSASQTDFTFDPLLTIFILTVAVALWVRRDDVALWLGLGA